MTRPARVESQVRTEVQRAVEPDLPGSNWVELLRALAGSIAAGAR